MTDVWMASIYRLYDGSLAGPELLQSPPPTKRFRPQPFLKSIFVDPLVPSMILKAFEQPNRRGFANEWIAFAMQLLNYGEHCIEFCGVTDRKLLNQVARKVAQVHI